MKQTVNPVHLLYNNNRLYRHIVWAPYAPTWRPILNSVIFRGTFSRITRLGDIAQPCGLHTFFVYHSSTTCQFLDFIYWMVEDYIFSLAWRCVRWKPPIDESHWTVLFRVVLIVFRVLTFYNISPDFSLLCRLQSSRTLLRKRIILFYSKIIGMETLLLTSHCNFGYASCVGDLLHQKTTLWP